MDLAEGATEQAGVTEELTATIDEVSERVSGNAKNAKDISKEVESSEEAVMISNQKMQEMVEAMDEISNTSQEIGNIITGAYLNSLSMMTNLTIIPTPPSLTLDMAGAILSVPAIEFGTLGDKILLIQTQFTDDKLLDGFFILVPDLESYDKIMASLGCN